MRLKAQKIMDVDEFNEILGRVGLNKLSLARLLKRDEKATQRWSDGTSKVPNEIAIILRLMDRRPELKQVIRECAE